VIANERESGEENKEGDEEEAGLQVCCLGDCPHHQRSENLTDRSNSQHLPDGTIGVAGADADVQRRREGKHRSDPDAGHGDSSYRELRVAGCEQDR
jgi:hypothetical protein